MNVSMSSDKNQELSFSETEPCTFTLKKMKKIKKSQNLGLHDSYHEFPNQMCK